MEIRGDHGPVTTRSLHLWKVIRHRAFAKADAAHELWQTE